MSQGQVAPDGSWSALADVEEGERARQMDERFRAVVALPDEERIQQLEGMVQAEFSLDDQKIRSFTGTRLRTWLAINREDHETANALARGYDAVFDRLPGSMAMRRATVVQTVAREDLTPDEVTELFDLVPSLVRSVPRAKTPMQRDAPAGNMAVAGGGTATMAPARPWWKFWG